MELFRLTGVRAGVRTYSTQRGCQAPVAFKEFKGDLYRHVGARRSRADFF